MMNIRIAEQKDVNAVKRLLVQLGYPDLDESAVSRKIGQYSWADYHLLVTETTEHVIGFIALHCFDIFHSAGKVGRITAFCIDESCRGQGIGNKMLKAAEEFFLSKECTKFEVSSNIRRTASHRFYLNAGYIEDSRKFVKYFPAKPS
jgi:N-acetylglutamate synthase-like GNAT family acetyltransferase